MLFVDMKFMKVKKPPLRVNDQSTRPFSVQTFHSKLTRLLVPYVLNHQQVAAGVPGLNLVHAQPSAIKFNNVSAAPVIRATTALERISMEYK